VRGHAAWALGRIGGAAAREGLERASAQETDPEVCQEIGLALHDVSSQQSAVSGQHQET
jgi:epoxyqueuosine reductase